jgi:hypothetical protein
MNLDMQAHKSTIRATSKPISWQHSIAGLLFSARSGVHPDSSMMSALQSIKHRFKRGLI